MKDLRFRWWGVSHDGIIVTYGDRCKPALDHHDGHSTPIVNVRKEAGKHGIILETASGSRYLVEEDASISTPSPAWRGLGTTLVQRQRKCALLAGEVFGTGAQLTIAERIAWRSSVCGYLKST